MPNKNKVAFRFAERKDTSLILRFIKELAEYEKLSHEVVADEQTLETWIFDKNKAEVLFLPPLRPNSLPEVFRFTKTTKMKKPWIASWT